MKQVMKSAYPVLILAALVVIGAIVLINMLKLPSLGDLISKIFPNKTTVEDSHVILEAVRPLGNLETQEMSFARQIKIHHDEGLANACFESLIYISTYTITAGINLNQIAESNILVSNDGSSKTVTMTLPPAEILRREEDSAHADTIQETSLKLPIFCDGGSHMPSMTTLAVTCGKYYSEVDAREQGILKRAQDEATIQISKLLNKLGYSNITIEFDQGTQSPVAPESENCQKGEW